MKLISFQALATALESDTDSSLTIWDGARRQQLQRWPQIPLAEMILALEEMQVLAEKLSRSAERK